MPSFVYKAKQKDARTVNGQVIAADREEAIEKLNQMELLPIEVEELAGSRRGGKAGGPGPGKFQTLYSFSRQLGNLLKGGVPILKALEIITRQQRTAHYRNIIESLQLGIRGGKTLSDGLAEYPQTFPPFYIAMVKAGEETGSLKETMADLAEYFRNRGEIAVKIRNAFLYPLLMALLGLGSVIFILTYVLPKLSVLYDQFGQALPGPTRFVMKISELFINGWPGMVLAVVVGLLFLKNSGSSRRARLRAGRIKLQLPVIGPFLLKVEFMRFCRTLELLLKSGVPIVRAVQMAIPVVDNEQIRADLEKCRERLLAGGSLAESLREVKALPDIVATLLAVGEESGNITESLHDIAENYRQETEESIKTMTTLLEPLLIIIVGSVIGFIVIAMLLPIFNLDMMVS